MFVLILLLGCLSSEITDKQLRQTIITLYFLNPDTYEIIPEARQFDAKKLLDNPYIAGLTLVGGEPFDQDLEEILELVRDVKLFLKNTSEVLKYDHISELYSIILKKD